MSTTNYLDLCGRPLSGDDSVCTELLLFHRLSGRRQMDSLLVELSEL